MPILKDVDIDSAPLQGKTIAMLGYGNQGKPQALNLRDSGCSVIIGTRPEGERGYLAQQDGFEVYSISKAIQKADVVMWMLPDEVIPDIWESVEGQFRAAQYHGFAHGLVIFAEWIKPGPEQNIFLVSPKAQGRGVRKKYLSGQGIPALYATHQDPAGDTASIALAYAKAIGAGRVGVIETSFEEETVCDLFSEQTVLCGGLTNLIKSAFETLVEAGYSPHAAYFECLYEVKLIADLLHEKGINGMRQGISSTALFGDLSRGERVIDGHVKETMRQVLREIQSGRFANEMRSEFEMGKPLIRQRLAADQSHPIEEIHRQWH